MSGRLLPGLGALAVFVCCLGGGLGFSVADAALAQSDLTRIALVSVPAAWLSILLFVTLAFWAALGLLTGERLPFFMAQAVAPTGGMFTFLALWTGALWSKGAGGGWWIGDARQIAELIVLVVYVAIIAVPALLADMRAADRLAALLAVVGGAHVPMVFFSVHWWDALRGSEAPVGSFVVDNPLMIGAVVCMTLGFWLYATLTSLLRLRHIILEREYVMQRAE